VEPEEAIGFSLMVEPEDTSMLSKTFTPICKHFYYSLSHWVQMHKGAEAPPSFFSSFVLQFLLLPPTTNTCL
jgi:hypothetical protein